MLTAKYNAIWVLSSAHGDTGDDLVKSEGLSVPFDGFIAVVDGERHVVELAIDL